MCAWQIIPGGVSLRGREYILRRITIKNSSFPRVYLLTAPRLQSSRVQNYCVGTERSSESLNQVNHWVNDTKCSKVSNKRCWIAGLILWLKSVFTLTLNEVVLASFRRNLPTNCNVIFFCCSAPSVSHFCGTFTSLFKLRSRVNFDILMI